jgi:CHAD domain-containing protein
MNRPAPQEIEAKFLVSDPALVAPLRTAAELAPGYRLQDAGEVRLVDEYVDTPDFRLLRNGYGLRIRRHGARLLATLKSRRLDSVNGDRDALFERLEIEEPLAFSPTLSPITGWPDAIMLAIAPLLNGAAGLQTICRLEQTRQKRLVIASPGTESSADAGAEHNDGATLAELSFDAICIRSGGDGPLLAHSYELEIELLAGRAQGELPALVAVLQNGLALAPSPVSKLEHALSIIGRHPAEAPENWQGLRSNMHMAEACRLIWREQLTALLLNEAGVRFSVDPEYVHDMRVATRRARAAAKLYGEFFRPKAIRRHLRALQRTARLLGAVRDLDVAIARLLRFGGKRRRPAADQTAITLATWREQRAVAHAELLAWFNSPAYARFVTRFAGFCAKENAGARDYTPKLGERPVPHQVRHVAPSMILNHFENVRSFETLFEGETVPPVEVLHLLRIGCKYLRYNLEFVENLLGPQSAELLAELRTLQEDLGELNDAAVSKRMMQEAQASADPGVSRYERAQDKLIHKLSSKAEKHLRIFVGNRNRRRLALAIARI